MSSPDRLSRPLLAGLAIAACLAWSQTTANPEARGATPPALPPPGAVFTDLEILHLRAHAAAARLAEWDVGVHPLPAPFPARGRARIASVGNGRVKR